MVPPNMPLTTSSPVSSPPSQNGAQDGRFGPMHGVICSQVTTVSGYVLFQFQHKKLSPFDEHGSIMRAVIVVLFLYAVGMLAELKLHSESYDSAIMKQFTALFGLLAVVLLLFILSLPLGLAASIIWGFLMVGQIISLLQKIIHRQAPRDNTQNV